MITAKTKTRRYSARTHIGHVRTVNEDAILALPQLGLWAVADGMGGYAGGDVASQTVIDALAGLPTDLTAPALPDRIRAELHAAHHRIRHEAARHRVATMGTTIILLALAEDHFLCLWAGDSRLYRLRQGRLAQISEDHSVVQAMVAAGQISRTEAACHPQRNQITRAIGIGTDPGVEKRRGAATAGDRFLLCSDGLTSHVDDLGLERLMRETPIDSLANTLIKQALAGGGADNVSVIAVEV
ncbi:protein phosphatase 2C domain-containing protein [uncultured Roseobacter sp.]|uniref:PP2C family protein-serine/threonine phosphatase n=1 Tax=uncultured Roseobacter sp. TaxID=114847 RepID=UPI00262A8F0C|nr:protein phosphatase 2C domain-containing protein [uncultured Roseobacter sp.]